MSDFDTVLERLVTDRAFSRRMATALSWRMALTS